MANEFGSKAEKESKRNLNLTLALFAAYRARHGAARTRVDRNRRVVLVVVAVFSSALLILILLTSDYLQVNRMRAVHETVASIFVGMVVALIVPPTPGPPHLRKARSRISANCGIRRVSHTIIADIQPHIFLPLPPIILRLSAHQASTLPRSTSAKKKTTTHLLFSRSATSVYLQGSMHITVVPVHLLHPQPAQSTADPATTERMIVDIFNKYKGVCPNHFGHPVSDHFTFDP